MGLNDTAVEQQWTNSPSQPSSRSHDKGKAQIQEGLFWEPLCSSTLTYADQQEDTQITNSNSGVLQGDILKN